MMDLTTYSLMMIPVTCAAVVALAWTLTVLVRQREPGRPLVECILGASVGCVLILIAEMYLLSALPGDRPLAWLPLLHVAIVAAFAGWSLRQGGGRTWTAAFRELVAYAATLSIRSSWLLRGLLALAAVIVIGCFLLGYFRVPSVWDELEYHIPMAVQPYQEGRIGAVDNWLPWAQRYPRGTELLWYWTLQWTRSDALFHPVLLALGIQYLLATYVLARRSGVESWAALVGSAVLATMPTFYLLTTTGYIDMAAGAGIVALLAFLAPVREGKAAGLDWLLAACAFAECCLVKAPVLATALGGIALAHRMLFGGPLSGVFGRAAGFATSKRLVICIGLVALSSHTYLANWHTYRNPLYPLAIWVGGKQVFAGPMDTRLFGGGSWTTMGQIAKMSRPQLFYAGFADLFQPLNPDSFGSMGPVFLIGILFPLLMYVLRSAFALQTWGMALAAMLAVCYLTPSFVPRYGLPMLAIATVGAMWTVGRMPRELVPAATGGILLLCMVGVLKSTADAHQYLVWLRQEAGRPLSLRMRSAFVHEIAPSGLAYYAGPEMIKCVRARSGAGDTLVWNVETFQGLLWNRAYSNRLVRLPGTAGDDYPGGASRLSEPSDPEMERWLGEIRRIDPKHILVYSRSAYARRIEADPSLGYQVALAEPADRETGGMVLFERRSDQAGR